MIGRSRSLAVRIGVAAATAFVATALASRVAHAEPAPPSRGKALAAARPSKARESAEAQQWFARGVAAARAGDHGGARRAFGLAYALVPSVDILWNLAAAERLAGDAVEALRHLRTYLASPEARLDRKKLAEGELVPELEAQTARLRFEEPEGSVVLLDGVPIAPSSTIDVAPGVHAVVVQREGVERAAAASAIAGAVVTFSLEAAAKTEGAGRDAAGPTRPVTIAASPIGPAMVPTPAIVPPSAPVEIVTRAPGRTTTVLALGGVAVAALATGIVFAVVARADQAQADRLEVQMRDDDRTCRRAATLCADYDSATSAAQRSMLLSSSLLATGGVMGGAAIAAWVLWPTSTTRVVPVTGKDVAGAAVTGTF